MEGAQATFRSTDAAIAFIQSVRATVRLPADEHRRYSGFMTAGPEKIRSMADSLARRLGPLTVAKLAARNGLAVSFSGVHCECCGAALSNPESILAGRGPKCLEAAFSTSPGEASQ